MKIAFILPELKGGGIGTYYRNLIKALLQQGKEVITILANYEVDDLDPEFPGKVYPITLEDYRQGLAVHADLDAFPAIRHKVALSYACKKCFEYAGEADIIELTDFNLLFYHFLTNKKFHTVIRLAGSSGQLELFEERNESGPETALLMLLEQSLINEADYIVALSKSNQQYWQPLLSTAVNVHLPYVDYPTSESEASERSSRGIVLGRLQLWKGAKFLCEYYRLYPKSPAVDWIGGDNFYLRYNNRMSEYLKKEYQEVWSNQLNFIGRKEYAAAQAALSGSAFVLIPSTWDTFNFVVTEAMWQGKIVLASTGAGASELINDGVDGFLFESGNVESLKYGFSRLSVLNNDEKKRMSKAVALKVRTLLGNQELLAERINLFEEIYKKPKKTTHIAINHFVGLAASGTSFKRKIHRQMSLGDLAETLKRKVFN